MEKATRRVCDVSQEGRPKSGYYYPNLIIKIYLEAIEEVMGGQMA